MNRDRTSPWPSRLTTAMAFAVIIAVLALAGCATTERVVPRIETRTVEVPPSLLRCMPEPQARAAWASQRDVALFLIKLAEAGEDCRLRLEAIRKLLEKQ